MRAVEISKYGGPSNLTVVEVPKPTPNNDQVLIKIMAFGLNRAETYMRQGLWGDVAKISGIECAGIVAEDPSGRLKTGQTVVALMGGMGRSINGSYAEYTVVPNTNVIPVHTTLSWPELAAIPESYATAWQCLTQNLKIAKGQTLLIRGGTSALGQAAINIAKNIEGVKIIATTRNSAKAQILDNLGVNQVVIDNGNISDHLIDTHPKGIDAVLELTGNNTLLDSLKTVRTQGYLCNAGFLGGGNPINFNPLSDLPSGVNLNFFASFMFGTHGFLLDHLPFNQIIKNVEDQNYKVKPVRVLSLEQLPYAHTLMEENNVNGKIVMTTQ